MDLTDPVSIETEGSLGKKTRARMIAELAPAILANRGMKSFRSFVRNLRPDIGWRKSKLRFDFSRRP